VEKRGIFLVQRNGEQINIVETAIQTRMVKRKKFSAGRCCATMKAIRSDGGVCKQCGSS